MPIFIKLKDCDRAYLFNLVKKNIHISWEKFYPQLNISRTMFFNYLSGRYDIPENLFLRLEKISNTKIENYKEKNKNKYIKKKIGRIKMGNNLAEIFGILNGDGHLDLINHEICVVGNLLEEDYFIYLKKIFENTFGLKFNFQIQENKIKLRTYSKDLMELLTKEYHFPQGNKLGKLKIPKQVYLSKKWLICYIRGLFDTDGTIYKRRKKDFVLEISSADNNFLREVRRVLFYLGFKPGISGKHIYIYNKEEIKRFFKVIKPANHKHLKNFKLYSSL